MQKDNTKFYFQLWEKLLKKNEIALAAEVLDQLPIADISEWLTALSIPSIVKILTKIPYKKWGVVFAELPHETQRAIYCKMEKKKFALLFSCIPSDQRADFYQFLHDKERIQLLPFLAKKIKENVLALSGYPPETAGGIMSTDFATIHHDMSIAEALQKLREDAPSKQMIYYLYVVNHQMQLMGFVTLKDLILEEPSHTVAKVLHKNFVAVQVTEDREKVAQQVAKYNLVAIPVLNPKKQLVGIVLHDDVLDIVRAEEKEDMEKFMGIVPDEASKSYFVLSVLQHFKKRVVWITGLFVASLLSSILMTRYESILEKLTILAFYIPMITSTGGNIGSQAASVIIRALSAGQISLKNWWKILFKELKIAFLIAICLFCLSFLKVYYLSHDFANIVILAITIAFALSMQVIFSSLVGTILPLVVKYLKGDPAIVASPAITTLVDIIGLIIYFTAVFFFLC